MTWSKPIHHFQLWLFLRYMFYKGVVEEITENISPLTRSTIASQASNKNCFEHELLLSLQLQSDDVMDSNPSEGGNVEEHETVTFVDSASMLADYGNTRNDIISSGATSGTNLADFLSRPTLINTSSWTTSTTVGVLTQIEPWYQLMNNSVIKNKISNYAFFRGKLCLKFVINGTPFHFGMVRIAYEPSVNVANTGPRKSKIRTNPTSSYPLLTPYSQLPGVYLYPSANAGAELCVPYFNHKSWVKLLSASDLKALGTLTYFVGIPLDIASATGSTALQINTYAWVEDIELSGSTAELVVQSKDEYTGAISYPASALASIAKKLDSIPVFGKYARATNIAATAIAQVSSIFGFTNVPVIESHKPFVPQPFNSLSTSEISQPIHKLTLDPKQELSIDPSLFNLPPVDEMAIKHIVSKETIFHVFDWSSANQNGDVIANWRVTPMLFDSANIVDGSSVVKARRIYHSWVSYVSMMFEHWRGDLIFDIEVVCTKFHKGRLQISWDPECSNASVQKATNSVYTTILDIGEVNKASIRVPYHQAFEWLKMRTDVANNWSVNSPNSCTDEVDNGVVIVSVLNPLVSPVSPQTVHLIMKVRAADNFELANPRSTLGQNIFSAPPSFFDVQSGDTVDIEAQSVTFGDVGSKHPHRYDLNMGERIVSLRALMRRMSLAEYNTAPDTSATRQFMFVKSYSRNLPSYGFDPNGLSLATGTINTGASFNFNSNPTHPLTYISNMYGGFRGGVNFTVNFAGGTASNGVEDVRVSRVNESSMSAYRRGVIGQATLASSNPGVVSAAYQVGWPFYGTAGSTFTNEQTNGALSFYYPYMSGTLFQYPDPNNAITGGSADQSNSECVFMNLIQSQQAANTSCQTLSLTTYAGAGVDYTCLWLLCCPTVDYYTPTPTVTA